MKATPTLPAFLLFLCCGVALAQQQPEQPALPEFPDSLQRVLEGLWDNADSASRAFERRPELQNPLDSQGRLETKIPPTPTEKQLKRPALPAMGPPPLPKPGQGKTMGAFTKGNVGPSLSTLDRTKEGLPEHPDPQTYFGEMPVDGPGYEWVERTSEYKTLVDSIEWADMDSLAVHHVDRMAGRAADGLEAETGEGLEGLNAVPGLEGLPVQADPEALREHGLQRLEGKKAQRGEIPDGRALAEGRDRLNSLKPRYAQVPDTRNLKGAIKKHSLGGFSFFQRLEAGVNAQPPGFSPFYLETKPFVGYRIDKKLTLGGMGGFSLSGDAGSGKLAWQGLGAYSLYRLGKGLFVIGEYQRLKARPGPHPEQGKDNFPAIRGGLGTEFALWGRLHIRSAVLYGLNGKEILRQGESLSPWQVNIGIAGFKHR